MVYLFTDDGFTDRNILPLGNPMKTKIQPISNVSTKPVAIGTTDTKTRTSYQPTLSLFYKSSFVTQTYKIKKNEVK